MARDGSTYRGARRNQCLRLEHTMWGSDWYYGAHRNVPRWALDRGLDSANNRAIHVPWTKRAKRKAATTTGGVHALLKRGDYAGAMRAFFSRKGKASGRGQ